MHREIHPLARLAAVVAGVITLSGNSPAALLANYHFNTDLNSSGHVFTGTVGAFGFSGGTLGGSQGRSSAGNAYFRGDDLTTTTTSAIANGDYFTFTITPGSGTQYQLESLVFTLGTQNDSGEAFTGSVAVFSSSGGFVAGSQIGSTASRTSAPNTALGWNSPVTIDLSGFSPLAPGVPVEFRLYASISNVGGSNVGNRIVRLDDIQLNGTSVPEPSAAILGAFGMLALVRRKR